MHIVHKKSKEDNNTGDDLAVLGVFFQIAKSQQTVSNKTLKALEKITSLFERVTYNGKLDDFLVTFLCDCLCCSELCIALNTFLRC